MRKPACIVCFQFVLYSISFHVLPQSLIFQIFPLFLVAREPAVLYLRIELSSNNCSCLAIYWSMELSICQSFCSHAFTLFVFYWRRQGFLPRGWWRRWRRGWGSWSRGVSSGRGGGVVHAFCAACLVILWHHLSTSKPSSGDVFPIFLAWQCEFPFDIYAHLLLRMCLSLYC